MKMKIRGDEYTGASQGRLNNKPSANGSGAWVPNDLEGCLDVIFNKMEHVKEIRTQGHPNQYRFTKAYQLFYSTDGKTFENEVFKVMKLKTILSMMRTLIIVISHRSICKLCSKYVCAE